MTSTATKPDASNPATHQVKAPWGRLTRAKIFVDQIATAAYYKAKSRGIAPGKEIKDWLQAEAELLQQAA